MICTVCGKTGEPELFSRVNRSADGKRAMCRQCKAAIDADSKQIAFNTKLLRMQEPNKVPFLLKHGYIDAAMFGRIESAAFDYLTMER
jgi:hypothetical protein